MRRPLVNDKDWAVVEDQICLVTDFTPMVEMNGARIASVNGWIPGFRGPYACVWLRSERGEEMPAVIKRELDFLMLWAAFNEHTNVRKCRMDAAPPPLALESSDDSRPDWLKQTVARFQAYYAHILKENGHNRLQSVIERHRESLNSLEPETRVAITTIIGQATGALPEPEEVWLTWTRKRYRNGLRRALFKPFLPRLVVRVARQGVFETLRMPHMRRAIKDRAMRDAAIAARALPMITWTPEVMER